MSKTLVLIPTYNEAANIERLVRELLALPSGVDVCVVDDGNDATSDIVSGLARSEPRVSLLRRGKKDGRGSAVLAGLRQGLERDFETFVEMDADFSHDPQELGSLLAAAIPGKVVIGSRYVKGSKIVGWPLGRRIFSKAANLFARTWLRSPLYDLTNGYRIYDRAAAQALASSSIRAKGYIVLSESAYVLGKKGFSFTEIPTVFVNRQRGKSNFDLREAVDAFLHIIRIPLDHRDVS